MATVNIGNIKLNWKGAYNGSTAYAIDDVVSYNGSSYVCIQASTGNLPTVTAYWEQMSQKGTDADLINITGTVQGDLYYNNGSAIARLGAGTSGQVLQTGGSGANPSWGTVSSDYVKLLASDYTTAVSSVDLDNIFSSTYRGYKVLIEDARADSNNFGELQLRFLNTSGNQVDGSYYIMNASGHYHSAGSSAGTVSGYDNNRSSARLGNWNMATSNEPEANIWELTFGQMHLNKEHSFIYTAKIFDANGNYDASIIGGVRYNASVATRGINLQINGGHNFSAYRMTVWGLK